MPREISDQDWAVIQTELQIANEARALWNDPQLGPETKALLKKKNPNVQIPDHDIRTEMRDGFAAMEQRLQAEKDAEKRKQEDDYWMAERKRVKDEWKFTEEGMKELEDTMRKRNIGDYEVAATFLASKNPKPSESYGAYKDPYWNHGKSDTFKEIAKDPEEWGRSEIMKALINDQQRNRQGGF